MNPRLITNYHTHTVFCDGMAEPVCYADEAVRQGMASLGFSAHASVNFPTNWTINPARLGAYRNDIHRLKREYADSLDIYCGLEADYFPDIFEEVRALYSGYQWDYIIGSVHFTGVRPNGRRWCIDGPHEDFLEGWRELTDCDPLLPVRRYFEITREMVRVMKPDIIGHMDKIKIQYRPDCMVPDTHPFFREQVMATLEEIAASGCIVEVSTRGIQKAQTPDYFPGRWAVAEMQKMGIPVTVSSDAHTPATLVFGFSRAETMLRETGYRTVMMLKNGKWEERPI
ncbi:MAG: histidinol-phosphatase [Bacteroidales bacterium]|jgi:histidinol-phosphatase (PHP family)|nr:histidinol-phosphatase [Bacteroidales bacterium]